MIEKILTAAKLTEFLNDFGVGRGAVLCIHTSLQSLGYVVGGARAVVEGLLDAVGPTGTIMMPAFSGDLSDPQEWRHPPAPRELWPEIMKNTPAYDPDRTPTRGIGAVAEYFRCYPDVIRSGHPQSSFCARGPEAKFLTSKHPLSYRFGKMSPLSRIVDAGGYVLLLGVPENTVSLFHLVEHYMPNPTQIVKRSPIMVDCQVHWQGYQDIEQPIDWFESGIVHLISNGIATQKQINGARVIKFSAAAAISSLVPWRQALTWGASRVFTG